MNMKSIRTLGTSPVAVAFGAMALTFLLSDAAYAGAGGEEFDEFGKLCEAGPKVPWDGSLLARSSWWVSSPVSPVSP